MAKKTARTTKGKMAAEIGAGLAAVGAAAAAGYYFYGSKQAKNHRKIAAKWASDMKKDVLRETKRLKNIDAKDFAKVVDAVATTYRTARSVNAGDVKRAANELKSNWEMVRREMRQAGRTGATRAKVVEKRSLARGKQTVKKVVKKASTKARKSRT